MSEEFAYTLGNVLIEPYKFKEISKLKVIRKANEHAELYLKGIIAEEYENSDKYVECADDKSEIKVSIKNYENETEDLFYGMVTSISLDNVQEVKSLEIRALGNTCLMDIKKKRRSFQGNKTTYNEIFRKVKSSYSNANMIDNVSDGKAIKQMVVQYNETDWEFLKRLTSHFNAVIIPECTMSGIKYTIGVPDLRRIYDLKHFNYSMSKEINEYQLKSAEGVSSINDSDFLNYKITTNKILDLYGKVKFNNRNLYVYQCEIEAINGILTTTCMLRDENGMKIPRIYNEKLKGVSLEGKIVSVKKDIVKVALGIDSYSNTVKVNTEWFPYSTVFSSPDGTGWYCMPEIGDAIRMYIPDNDEKNAYVISSVDLECRNEAMRSNPDHKSLSTKYGKKILLKPGEIDIFSGGNSMILNDEKGIIIDTDKNITMTGEKIEINGDEVTIIGKNGVKLIQASASIDIDDDITMDGFKINAQ